MTHEGDIVDPPEQRAVVDVTEAAASGEQSLTLRSKAAAARESAVDSRERAAMEREQALGVREQTAERREATVLKREKAADLRDELARERDVSAEARDTVAEGRDREASTRDDAARIQMEASEPTLSPVNLLAAEEARAAGVLDRTRASADRRFSAGDRVHSLADRVASAQDRKVAADEHQTAIVDELTGVLRRGPGLYQLDRDLARAIRSGQQFVLAFVDVVGLKAVNDAHGHPVGDDVIRWVADALVAQLRPYDSVLRYGGDEFLCVLSGISLAEARRRLAAVNAALSGREPPASVTIGLAEFENDDTVESLIQRADADLYRQRGREVPAFHSPTEVGRR